MGLFIYQALSKDGKKLSGTVDAPTPEAARDWVIKNGMYPITVSTTSTPGVQLSGFKRILSYLSSVSVKDKILFTKQLAVLLKAGVPLLQAVELLIEQFSGKLRTILISVKDDLREGKSLAEALSKYPKVFDNIYIQLVRAGEATGKLETILERLTEYMERRQEVMKRVKGALTYPLIQLGVVVVVVIALLTFVVPNLVSTFASQKMELPLSTRILLGMSDFLLSYSTFLIIGVVLLYLAFRWWKSTPSGARTIDVIKLKIPVVRFFARMGAVVQFSRTLGMLVESGVNLAEALDIVVKVIDNRVLADALREARDKIIKQGKIAEYLRQTNIFPPIAIYLINTGEQTGQLDFMLLTIAKTYEDDLAEYSNTLSALLGPIMLLVMGVVVGFVVLSIIQPILGQTQAFNI
ncbi:MAG: Type II secretion system protein F [Candidatus Dependentiae bacterium ADurb.Bin331]|nr:MAG: Type II secretion system protein F [Candidatus Dependentiae bacterium ADurb.Bin331]